MLTQEEITKRKSHIGGSDIPIICGVSSYKKAHRLWLEKTGQVEAEDISNMPHVVFGNQMESIIREWTEQKYGTSFHPTRLEYKEWPVAAANLDGLSVDNVVLEIKTVGIEKNIKASLGQIPEEYYYQLQWNMMVAGADKGIYVSYYKDADETHYIEVDKDVHLQEEMLKQAKNFWLRVENNTPLVEISNELKSLISAWKAAKLEADSTAARAEALQNEIKEKLSENDIEYDGVKITHYEQKGNIDYGRIEALKTMDLEQYRKAPSKRVRFSL